MKMNPRLLVGAAIVWLAAPGLSMATASVNDELTFAVSLDDQPIGVHRFRITQRGATHMVDSAASFDVKILRVPVYRYRHNNIETWRNGCLNRIESETDANGTRYAVDLNKTTQGYTIETPNETRIHQVHCMMSFAYWDQQFLKQERLLNTQTGEWIAVKIQPLGESERKIADRTVPVTGFRILAEPQNVDIKVFYHRTNGRWVALESVLENGRVLRYAPAKEDRVVATERVSDNPLTRR